MSTVIGNTSGLKKSELAKLEKLTRRRLDRDQILSYDLAEELCELSLAIKRQLSLILDFQGHVEQVLVWEHGPTAGQLDQVPQMQSLLPASTRAGVTRKLLVQTRVGWGDPDLGSQVTVLQFNFPAIALLTAGVDEGFSRSKGENPHFCDGAVLLSPSWDPQGNRLVCEISDPMTARALGEESLETWVDWAETLYQGQANRVKSDPRERAILMGVHTPGPDGELRLKMTMDELVDLAQTAGARVVGEITQSRPQPDPKTFIGRGKADTLAMRVQELQADVVIADDTLTPVQQRNLEQILRVKVIDRTEVILDIFARRARSREGQIQVELAQLQYLLPRLIGRGRMFSQQTAVGAKGGIATRGPGETKLETDRRIIHQRIDRLEAEADAVAKHRAFQRQQRISGPKTTASLVGYTNAGKSTLLRALTGSDVLVEDKLFATLDPTTRRLYLPNGEEMLLTDTVGFIQKLPTFLVKAFRATLEEVVNTDLLIHVWDISHPDALAHLETVRQTLIDLDAGHLPVLTVCNKIDRVPDWQNVLRDLQDAAGPLIGISAETREGLDTLLAVLGTFSTTQTLPPKLPETVAVSDASVDPGVLSRRDEPEEA
jgi:GTP-binding protein HflX